MNKRGSALLSIIALAHQELFSGIVFLAVGYFPPGPFDIDEINTVTEKLLGYPAFGYMKFFNQDTAASVIDANPESLTSLLYPTTPEVWKTDMGPLGAAERWITAGKVTAPPPWVSQEEFDTHTRIFQKGKYTGPLNWYISFLISRTKITPADLSQVQVRSTAGRSGVLLYVHN